MIRLAVFRLQGIPPCPPLQVSLAADVPLVQAKTGPFLVPCSLWKFWMVVLAEAMRLLMHIYERHLEAGYPSSRRDSPYGQASAPGFGLGATRSQGPAGYS